MVARGASTMFSRSVLAAATFAASLTVAHAQTAPAPLTGLAAWAVLVGNTVAGTFDGKENADYYMADGTVKRMEGSALSTGKWSLEGPQVCFRFQREQQGCYTIEVVGKVATFRGRTGAGFRFDILDGNPKNL